MISRARRPARRVRTLLLAVARGGIPLSLERVMNTSSSLVASLGAVIAFAACSGKIVDNNPGEVDAPLPIDARW